MSDWEKMKNCLVARIREVTALKSRIAELESQLKSRLISPCDCKGVGMCIPCSMRERVAGGEDIASVVKDYE